MLIIALVVFMLVIFAVMVVFLRKIISQNVVSATSHLEDLAQDYSRKEQDLHQQLEDAKLQSQEMVQKTRLEVEQEKLKIIQDAQAQRDEMIKQAHAQADSMIQQADKSRQALLADLDIRIEKEAARKAGELMQEVLPEQFLRDVHKYWVEELIGKGFSGFKTLKITEDVKEIKITSAFKLSVEDTAALAQKLKEVLGPQMTLSEEVNPKIIAGVSIAIGSLVLDGSLKYKIQEKTKAVQNKV